MDDLKIAVFDRANKTANCGSQNGKSLLFTAGVPSMGAKLPIGGYKMEQFCSKFELWKDQFPDFQLDVIIPEGFEDISYRNDVCPSWVNEKRKLVLHVDYKDIRKSETRTSMEDGRFMLLYYPNAAIGESGYLEYYITEPEILIQTNNYDEVLQCIKNMGH